VARCSADRSTADDSSRLCNYCRRCCAAVAPATPATPATPAGGPIVGILAILSSPSLFARVVFPVLFVASCGRLLLVGGVVSTRVHSSRRYGRKDPRSWLASSNKNDGSCVRCGRVWIGCRPVTGGGLQYVRTEKNKERTRERERATMMVLFAKSRRNRRSDWTNYSVGRPFFQLSGPIFRSRISPAVYSAQPREKTTRPYYNTSTTGLVRIGIYDILFSHIIVFPETGCRQDS
jgi:hypothetical protein